MSIVTVFADERQSQRSDIRAEENAKLLRDAKVRTVSIIGGPGCGKTTLIERSVEAMFPSTRTGIIVCCNGITPDPQHLNILRTPVVGLKLGSDRFPNPWQLRQALDRLDLSSLDLLLIENIGGLEGCPPSAGQDACVAMFSVAAGHDKPVRHPRITAAADAIILSKIDLLSAVPFQIERFREGVRSVNDSAKLFELSALTGAGLDEWIKWLRPKRSPTGNGASHWFG